METMATDRNTFKTHCSKSVKRCANNFEIRKTIPKQLRKTDKTITEKQFREKKNIGKTMLGKKECRKKECWEKKNVGNQVKSLQNQVRGLLT